MGDLQAALLEAVATQQQLTRMLAAEQQAANEGYVGVEALVECLGTKFTKRKIEEDRRAGYFKMGRDYIDISNSSRPDYAYKVSRIRAIYETDPAKRRVYT